MLLLLDSDLAVEENLDIGESATVDESFEIRVLFNTSEASITITDGVPRINVGLGVPEIVNLIEGRLLTVGLDSSEPVVTVTDGDYELRVGLGTPEFVTALDTLAPGYGKAIAESVTVTEDFEQAAGLGIPEGATVTEGYRQGVGIHQGDGVTTSDAIVKFGVGLDVGEVVSAVDTFLKSIGIDIGEQVSATDDVTREGYIDVVVGEVISALDSYAITALLNILETINVEETKIVDDGTFLNKEVNETVTVVDTIRFLVSRVVQEVASTSDTAKFDVGVRSAESAAVLDAEVDLGVGIKVPEVTSALDAQAKFDVGLKVPDVALATDAPTGFSFGFHKAESVSVADLILLAVRVKVDEAISATDAHTLSTNSAGVIQRVESITVEDVLRLIVNLSVRDTVTIVDSFPRISVGVEVIDNISIVEAIRRTVGMHLHEAVNITEQSSRDLFAEIRASELVTATDALSRAHVDLTVDELALVVEQVLTQASGLIKYLAVRFLQQRLTGVEWSDQKLSGVKWTGEKLLGYPWLLDPNKNKK